MNKKLRNILICLLLGMGFISLSANANSLNKLDIKRSMSSASTLNMTIFTDNPYDENVAVTKKSDNKYVILMPNISGASSANVDFSSIKDVVSDVDVKTVDDGANGYTKVTLTTSKPVAITTSTKKSTPLTPEQKAYKNLIGQARGYAAVDTTPVQKTSSKTDTSAQKTVQTSTKPAEDVKKAATPVKQETQVRPKTVISQVKDAILPDKKADKTDKPDIKVTKTETKKVANVTPATTTVMPEGAGQRDETFHEFKKDILKENKQTQKQEANVEPQVPKTKYTQPALIDETDKKGTDRNMLTLSIIIMAALAGLIAFFKKIKSSLENTVELKKSFKENLNEKPAYANVKPPVYNNIAMNQELSWQEKYQKFLSAVDEINPADGILKHVGNGEYEFVNSADLDPADRDKIYKIGYGEGINSSANKSQLKPKKESKLKSYNRPAMNNSPKSVPPIKKVKNQNLRPVSTPKFEIVENKINIEDYKELEASLERTLHDSPSVERIDLDDTIILKQIENSSAKNPVVHKEEDSIANSIQKAPKFKSFANKIALEQTRRNMPLPKRSSDIIKTRAAESRHVNLETSGLYSASRRLADGNLNSSELLIKSSVSQNPKSTYLTDTVKQSDKDYTTVSVDEFFDTVDSSSTTTAPATLSSRVADSLIKISSGYSQTKKQPVKSNIMDGKNVLNSYKIDKNKGFYLISDENGTTSLIGRIKNDITVLKTFKGLVGDQLQVRHDENNVYIVKAGGERYLVEVGDKKMGVLLEL